MSPKKQGALAPEPSSGEYMALDDATRKALAEQPTVRVKLQKSQDPNKELPPVDVGVNGCFYRVERGIPTDVPETVAGILEESGHW